MFIQLWAIWIYPVNTDAHSANNRNASIPVWLSPPLSPPYDQDEIDAKDEPVNNDDTFGGIDKDDEHTKSDKIDDFGKMDVNTNDEHDDNVDEHNKKDLDHNAVKDNKVDEDAQTNKEGLHDRDDENSKRDSDNNDVGDNKDVGDDKDDKDVSDDKESVADTSVDNKDKDDTDSTNGFIHSDSFDENGSDDPNELTDEAPEPEELRKRNEHNGNVEMTDANVSDDKGECSTSTGLEADGEQSRRLRSQLVEQKKVWEM